MKKQESFFKIGIIGALYAMNLAKKWLKKDRLDMDEKHLIQDALHDAVARFEQRMNDDTVSYGNLQDWLVGNAFSRFQSLFEKAQKEKARLLPSKQLNCRPSRLIKKKILWSF